MRLRAAAAAVGIDEAELRRRVQAAGVKLHTLVRAGEAQPAVDLEDVWRLRGDSAPESAEPAENSAGVEISRVTARLEREAAEHRTRHAEAEQRATKLEEAVRLEKSRQAELEAQLSESARSLAETQRALMELRAAQAAREREFKTQLDDERRSHSGATQALETARLQAESAAGARVHAEKRLQEASSLLATAKDDLAAARRDNERLTRELGELKTLRARLSELESAAAQSAAALATERAETKAVRERAESREARLAELEAETQRLAEAEKRLAAAAKRAEQALTAAESRHAEELARRDADVATQRAALETRLKEALSAAAADKAARAELERELVGARGELDKLEESCTRATLERDRLKQRAESLSTQLASATEGEKALQRYADRKESELAALRKELGR